MNEFENNVIETGVEAVVENVIVNDKIAISPGKAFWLGTLVTTVVGAVVIGGKKLIAKHKAKKEAGQTNDDDVAEDID